MSKWGVSPRKSVAAECARRGKDAVVAGCIELLNGGTADADFHLALAGPAAAAVLRGEAGGVDGYWPRVWGARGLLYAWDESATLALLEAAHDEAWRVREMVLKVIARHMVGDGLDVAVELRTDPIVRVRRAAHRAAEKLVAARA